MPVATPVVSLPLWRRRPATRAHPGPSAARHAGGSVVGTGGGGRRCGRILEADPHPGDQVREPRPPIERGVQEAAADAGRRVVDRGRDGIAPLAQGALQAAQQQALGLRRERGQP